MNVVLFVLAAAIAAPTGSIKGKVTISSKDGSDKKDYSEVVVYVADFDAPVTNARAQMPQSDRQFKPRVLAVAAGTSVFFPNRDLEEHNIFSHSASADFDLGRYGRGPGKSMTFTKPGVVEIFCNVHPEMVAYVVVAPNPAFAVTGEDGTFTLTGVPPGKHKIVIWDRFARPKIREETVDVPAQGAATLDVKIVEQVGKEPPHKNKTGGDYAPSSY